MGMDVETLRDSRGYHGLVRFGLICYGAVHLVIAWIAVNLAFGTSGDASSQGALRQLTQQPLGATLLWAMAIGFFTLAAWQVIEATIGRRDADRDGRLRRRLASVGRALVYGVLGAAAVAVGSGDGGSGGADEETLSAALLRLSFGQVLVAAVGVGVAVVGVTQIVRGVKQNFVEDLDQHVTPASRQLGRIGFCTKGLSLIIIGVLFGWAAFSDDADKAGGLDAALGTIRDQPFGVALLIITAVGIGCFGLYCFAWARSPRY